MVCVRNGLESIGWFSPNWSVSGKTLQCQNVAGEETSSLANREREKYRKGLDRESLIAICKARELSLKLSCE